MTAVIIQFPIRTVRVLPDGCGWFVIQGEHGDLFGSRERALNEAWALARAQHGVRVIVAEPPRGGAA